MIAGSSIGSFLRKPAVLRRFWKADITICIPAYEAETFIDRTLRCAGGQTYGRLRILVSVDRSQDRTAELCRHFAAADPRIDIVERKERLGWNGNVNALLKQADTPFFFLYFHDDLILPQYCERLRGTLLERPEAASANCDLFDFGLVEALQPARAYEGSTAQRILTLWAVPKRGALLRSMVRTDRAGPDFRLPPEEADRMTPGEILLMRLVAAGPAVPVSETLYLRWRRKGGLTHGYGNLPFEAVLDGWRNQAAVAFAIVDEIIQDPRDRIVLKFALTLYIRRRLIKACRDAGRLLPEPADFHPEAPSPDLPGDLDRFGTEIADWLRKTHGQVAAHRSALA